MSKHGSSADAGVSEKDRSRPVWKRFLPLAALVLVMAAAYGAGLQRYLDFDAILQQRHWLKQAVADNRLLAVLSFGAVYAGAVALSFPGGAFLTLLGGFLFGSVLGSFVNIVSATLGAIAIFSIARSALGETLRRMAGPALTRFLDGFKSDAASYLLFVRLVPAFPFWLVNIAAGVGGAALPVFAWTTLVGIIPGTTAFSVAGAGLDSVIAAQQSARAACQAAGRGDCGSGIDLKALLTPELLIAFGLLGCVALIPVIWRSISKRRQVDQGGKA